ncbi:MAG: hypothetical protein U0105_23760 [Candidatus Obscuribacterales bacterium]
MGDIQHGSDNTSNAGNGSANQPGEAFRQDYLSELAGPPSGGGKVPERPENPQGEPATQTPSGGDADPPRRGDADPPRRGDADPPRQGGDKDGNPERPSPGGGAGQGGDQPVTNPPTHGEEPVTGEPTHEAPASPPEKDPKNSDGSSNTAGGTDANRDGSSSSDSGSEGTKSGGGASSEGTFPSVHDHGGEMPPKKGGADPGLHDGGAEPGPKQPGSASEEPSSTGSGGDLIIPPLDYGTGAGSGPK